MSPALFRNGESMRFLKRLVIGLALLAAAFATVVALQPDDYRLTRQIAIAAPAATIFPYVNDLRQWDEWSPWAKVDPNAKISFEGPLAGPGAMFHWSGNDKVGAGTMTIIESNSPSLIHMNLEFFRPMEGTNLTEFTFRPEMGGTNVTWKMSGKNGFIGKAFCMFAFGPKRT